MDVGRRRGKGSLLVRMGAGFWFQQLVGYKVMPFIMLVPWFELMFPDKLEAWRWKGQKFKVDFGGQTQNILKTC